MKISLVSMGLVLESEARHVEWLMTRSTNRHSNVRGSNHAEIDCRNGIRVGAQECPPGLRRRPSVPDHIFGDLEPELQQFTVDAWGTPTKGSPCSSDG